MNDKLKKEYRSKLKKFNLYNKNYYEKNNPIVADYEFDKLKKEILDLEKKYNFLKNDKSPSVIVGYKPSKTFEKFSHKIPMLSLSNAFDERFDKFEKKLLII